MPEEEYNDWPEDATFDETNADPRIVLQDVSMRLASIDEKLERIATALEQLLDMKA